MSNKRKKTSERDIIGFTWESKNPNADDDVSVNISVMSRKLKDVESSPSGVLFRTHQYEFILSPNEKFFEWAGRRSGFMTELKLFKKKHDSTQSNDFQEYTNCGVPCITYSYTEDVFSSSMSIIMNWPENSRVSSWKGDFCFRITLFRKVDTDTYRRIITYVSSTFTIYSKPEVFIKQKRRAEDPAACSGSPGAAPKKTKRGPKPKGIKQSKLSPSTSSNVDTGIDSDSDSSCDLSRFAAELISDKNKANAPTTPTTTSLINIDAEEGKLLISCTPPPNVLSHQQMQQLQQQQMPSTSSTTAIRKNRSSSLEASLSQEEPQAKRVNNNNEQQSTITPEQQQQQQQQQSLLQQLVGQANLFFDEEGNIHSTAPGNLKIDDFFHHNHQGTTGIGTGSLPYLSPPLLSPSSLLLPSSPPTTAGSPSRFTPTTAICNSNGTLTTARSSKTASRRITTSQSSDYGGGSQQQLLRGLSQSSNNCSQQRLSQTNRAGKLLSISFSQENIIGQCSQGVIGSGSQGGGFDALSLFNHFADSCASDSTGGGESSSGSWWQESGM